MNKLIKKYYDGMQVHDILCECLDDYDTILTILEKFADTPTVDAVEVVRCKDCKRGETMKCPMYVAKFGYTDQDFCSCGERKHNE